MFDSERPSTLGISSFKSLLAKNCEPFLFPSCRSAMSFPKLGLKSICLVSIFMAIFIYLFLYLTSNAFAHCLYATSMIVMSFIVICYNLFMCWGIILNIMFFFANLYYIRMTENLSPDSPTQSPDALWSLQGFHHQG